MECTFCIQFHHSCNNYTMLPNAWLWYCQIMCGVVPEILLNFAKIMSNMTTNANCISFFFCKSFVFNGWSYVFSVSTIYIMLIYVMNFQLPLQVVGVEGIMSAYTSTLYSVTLAGPTLFGPIINKAAEIASHSLQYGNNKYFVLLIITVRDQISEHFEFWRLSSLYHSPEHFLQDGVLTDIQETKDSIVRASDLPLSILIVGVGNADFKQMEVKAFTSKIVNEKIGVWFNTSSNHSVSLFESLA